MDTKKSLKLIKYEVHENPRLHMHIFEDKVLIITLDKDFHTKLFPLTLKRSALKWFNKIPYNSIKDFTQLKRSFIDAFKVFIPQESSFIELMQLKQR